MRSWVGVAALCMAMLSGQAASAGTLRYPQTGFPAIAVAVPPGWRADDSKDSLTLFSPGTPPFAAVDVMLGDPEGQKTSDIAALLTHSCLSAPKSLGTVQIGGYPTEGYSCAYALRDRRYTRESYVLEIDATHFLVITNVSSPAPAGDDGRAARTAERRARHAAFGIQIVTQ